MKKKPMKVIPIGGDSLEDSKETGVYILDNFLSGPECAALIRIAKSRGMTKGTFNVKGQGKSPDTSTLIRLEDDATPVVKRIHARIKKLTQFPLENGEIFKVVCYQKGGRFNTHNDYKPFDENIQTSGRVAQMLFYLNEVEEGGETYFTHLGLKIVPVPGRALIWYGIEGMYLPKKGDALEIPKHQKPNPYALHCPMPVIKGEKWIAAKFLHDRNCE